MLAAARGAGCVVQRFRHTICGSTRPDAGTRIPPHGSVRAPILSERCSCALNHSVKGLSTGFYTARSKKPDPGGRRVLPEIEHAELIARKMPTLPIRDGVMRADIARPAGTAASRSSTDWCGHLTRGAQRRATTGRSSRSRKTAGLLVTRRGHQGAARWNPHRLGPVLRRR